MTSFRTIAALTAAAFVACTPTHSQTPHLDGVAAIESKTVALVRPEGAGARAFCTGVWVAPDRILTAAHCVDDAVLEAERVAYVTRDDLLASRGDELEAFRLSDVAAIDPMHDLALLRAELPPTHAVAEVADATDGPFVGEVTQTMGHPLGLWWSYSAGNVAAVRRFEGGLGTGIGADTWFVQTTAPTSPGNSGGGLWNGAGKLIGVCHAGMRRGQNLNVYVHAMHVRAFLSSPR